MKTLDDYRNFIAGLRKDTGIEAFIPDETGLVSVRIDDAFNVNLQYVAHNNSVLCFVEICQLPEDAPKKVYRELLTGSLFGKETAGGYFSIEDTSEMVVYSYFFDGNEVERDPEEFVAALEKILQLCGLWVERIQELLSPDSEPDLDMIPHHLQTIYP